MTQHHTLNVIYYVQVIEHEYEPEQAKADLKRTVADVDGQLEALSNGTYFQDFPKRKGFAEITKDSAGLYRACSDYLEKIEVTRRVISWRDLDKHLDGFLDGQSSMFDVTALRNNLLVDVVALLLARGCADVYSFEYKGQRRLKYDQNDLIHALTSKDYKYRCLGDSEHVQYAIRQMNARTVRFRKLLLITMVVVVVLLGALLVAQFFSATWIDKVVATIGTAAGVAGLLFVLQHDGA